MPVWWGGSLEGHFLPHWCSQTLWSHWRAAVTLWPSLRHSATAWMWLVVPVTMTYLSWKHHLNVCSTWQPGQWEREREGGGEFFNLHVTEDIERERGRGGRGEFFNLHVTEDINFLFSVTSWEDHPVWSGWPNAWNLRHHYNRSKQLLLCHLHTSVEI